MSITFAPATITTATIGYQLVCCFDHVYGACGPEAFGQVNEGFCDQCGEFEQLFCEPVTVGDELPEVNLSNANAFHVLGKLGIEFDHCGSWDAADFFARAAVMTVGCDDSGVDAAVDGNVVDCGLRAGYFGSVAERLQEVAQAAMKEGVEVSWS